MFFSQDAKNEQSKDEGKNRSLNPSRLWVHNASGSDDGRKK